MAAPGPDLTGALVADLAEARDNVDTAIAQGQDQDAAGANTARRLVRESEPWHGVMPLN